MRLLLPLFFFLFAFFPFLQAQSTGDDDLKKKIEHYLKGEGYENLAVETGGDTIFIVVENRRYRYDPRGYANLVKGMIPLINAQQKINIAILKDGVPVTSFLINKPTATVLTDPGNYKDSIRLKAEVTTGITRKLIRMSRKKPINPVYNKFEFVIYPQIKIQLGNFDDPFKSQFNIAPSLEVTLSKGLRFMGQVIIPLQNDLEPHGNQVRPGIIALNQFIRLPLNVYSLISVGYFTRNRYGLNAEFRKYWLNGRVSTGITGGYTGYAEMIDHSWQYTGVDLLTFFADAGYRWSKYDLTMKAGFGRFTDGNTGVRFDAYRQFREITIGFFALRTNGFMNGGFYFRVPIPPGKYGTKHWIRIRPESYFSYEYRARGLSDAGKYFSSGTTITDIFHNINPDFLRRELERELAPVKEKTEKK